MFFFFTARMFFFPFIFVSGVSLNVKLCQIHIVVSLSSADRTGSLGCIGWFIVILSGLFAICLFPFTIWFCLKVSKLSRPVKEQEPLFLANINVV